MTIINLLKKKKKRKEILYQFLYGNRLCDFEHDKRVCDYNHFIKQIIKKKIKDIKKGKYKKETLRERKILNLMKLKEDIMITNESNVI